MRKTLEDFMIVLVWHKATPVIGRDADEWRMDCCGSLIRWDEYGKQTLYGWEVDHIRPVALGGGDELYNLQPLQWVNNRRKGDQWPWSNRQAA